MSKLCFYTNYTESNLVKSIKGLKNKALILSLLFGQHHSFAMPDEKLVTVRKDSVSETQRRAYLSDPKNLEMTNKLKNLYAAQTLLPKLIDDSSIPDQSMEEYYVKLQIMLENQLTGEKNLSN